MFLHSVKFEYQDIFLKCKILYVFLPFSAALHSGKKSEFVTLLEDITDLQDVRAYLSVTPFTSLDRTYLTHTTFMMEFNHCYHILSHDLMIGTSYYTCFEIYFQG